MWEPRDQPLPVSFPKKDPGYEVVSIWLVSKCLPSERPKYAVALETCIEINKYKIYAKFIPFPNNNNLVTYHKILKIGERDVEQKGVKYKCAQAREHKNYFKAYNHTFLLLDFLTCLML
jgi:hypothetical protein